MRHSKIAYPRGILSSDLQIIMIEIILKLRKAKVVGSVIMKLANQIALTFIIGILKMA